MLLRKDIREVLSITFYNLKEKTIRRRTSVDGPKSTCYLREKGLHERFIQRNQHLLESCCRSCEPKGSRSARSFSKAQMKCFLAALMKIPNHPANECPSEKSILKEKLSVDKLLCLHSKHKKSTNFCIIHRYWKPAWPRFNTRLCTSSYGLIALILAFLCLQLLPPLPLQWRCLHLAPETLTSEQRKL